MLPHRIRGDAGLAVPAPDDRQLRCWDRLFENIGSGVGDLAGGLRWVRARVRGLEAGRSDRGENGNTRHDGPCDGECRSGGEELLALCSELHCLRGWANEAAA